MVRFAGAPRHLAGLLLLAAAAFAYPAGAEIRICHTGPPGRPLPPEIRARIEGSAPVDEHYGYRARVRRAIANRKAIAAGLMTREQAEQQGGTAVAGTFEFPVFPFLFSNSPGEPFPKEDLEEQLFGEWPTGTMQEYYQENSYGLFSVDGYVDDWFTLSEEDTWYEQDDWGMNSHMGTLIYEILDARDPSIDFSQYDNDGPDGMPNSGDDDGYVDFFAVVSPEFGGVCINYGVPDTKNLWPHQGTLGAHGFAPYETDDPSNTPGIGTTRIYSYFLGAALHCDETMDPIGTFCHEFGHALDIRDLYDLNPWPDADGEGLGHWCLMARGNRNTEARPAHMSAWCKERLGWLSYYNVTQDVTLSVPPIETAPFAVRLWTHGEITPEYFLVENRQPIGFDENVPAGGLLIYHVDEARYDELESTNRVNAYEDHKAIDLECADATTAEHTENADDLDTEANRGDAGDRWCPSTQDDFDGNSIPDSRSYSGDATQVEVRNIGSCNGIIAATFIVGIPLTADLCVTDCPEDDCSEPSFCDVWWGSPDIWIDNDDNGVDDFPADGIENHLWFRVRNVGPNNVAGATVSLYYSDPAMGQRWPSTGTLIGSRNVPILAPGETHEDYVNFEYPDPPAQVDHYCIGAVASHDVDIQNSEYPPNDDNVAQVNHQVLVQRAENGPRTGFHAESQIYLYGAHNATRFGSVMLGSPPDFNDAEIPPGWTVTFDPGPYTILPGGRIPMVVTTDAPRAQHGETAHVPLSFISINGETYGGVVLDYRVDNVPPTAPGTLVAEDIGFRPDDLEGPTTKLTWRKVTRDSEGLAEVVKRYEVYRSDDQGNPEVLVDKVAIDAEPDELHFQWYDAVVSECDVVYTYRVRAIDAAGNAGAFVVGDLVCAAASVDGGGQDGGRDGREGPLGSPEDTAVRAYPNPSRESTTLRFSLAQAGPVRIDVLDPAGRVVETLADRLYNAGAHNLEWRHRDASGARLPAGVYLCRVRTADRMEAMKLLVLE